MSKTYNLTATLNTGKNSALNDGNWSGYASTNVSSSEVGSIGRTSGPLFYATNMVFDSATMNTLRNKTINGVTLTLVITQGTDAPALVAWKYNSTSSGNTNSGAWARSNNSGTLSAGDASIATNANPSFAAGEVTTGTKTLTLKGLPQYGLVAGPFSDSRNGVWKISSATLNVTTNETDYNYTLAYNANGGSGAPSNQTGSNTGTSPYYTFTVSSTVPTRTGYTFLGWSTSSSATSASYVGGNSFTVTSSGTTTLYAVWKVNTYTVSYNANGGSGAPAAQTKTYGVSLTLSATIPSRTNYIFLGWATSATGTATYRTGTNHDQNTSYTANAAVTLYAIWQAAKSTLSSITSEVTVKSNIAGSGTASWNIVNTAYTYTLVITYSNAPAVTVNVAANTASTSFSIPTTWLSYMPNVSSATATATLTTYASGTSVGSTSLTFTVKVDDSVKPTISSFTHAPYAQNSVVNGWGQQYGTYVQGYSQVDLSVSATAGTGASIISIAFSGAGVSQSSTATTARSAVLSNTGRIDYSVTVTDSRNRSVTSDMTGDNRPYFYEYSNPVVTAMTAFRCNQSGTADAISGTYINTFAKFSLSSCGGRNTFSVRKIEYKLHSASPWTSAVSTAESEQWYTIGGGNIAITSSYDVRCTVTDALSHTTTYVVLVPPIVGFAVGLNNDRARFGGPVEKAGLQVDWDAEFNGVVDVTKRRCYATLSSAGWYRVIDVNVASATASKFSIATIVDINIGTEYWANSNGTHKISLHGVFNNVAFLGEESKSKNMLVSKIRYTYDSSGNGHIDIYYTGTSENPVWCTFAVHMPYSYQHWFVSNNFTAVAASPSGETVMATYSFMENTDGSDAITIGSKASSIDSQDLRKKRGVAYGFYQALSSSFSTGSWNTIGTIPTGYRPSIELHIPAVNRGNDTAVHCRITTGGSIDIVSGSAISDNTRISVNFTYPV